MGNLENGTSFHGPAILLLFFHSVICVKNTRISPNGNFNDLQTVKLVKHLFLCLHGISGLNIKVQCVRQHVLDMKDSSNHVSWCNASATI